MTPQRDLRESIRTPSCELPDTLYQVENGAYAAYFKACISPNLYEAMNLRQYNLVTLNYVVEIICATEPTITVTDI